MNSTRVCNDARKCFAKRNTLEKDKSICSILSSSYDDEVCPFCKPDREVTKGKRYPLDKRYSQ